MKSNISSDDRFNRMMINIGSNIFDLQVKLTRFVCEIFEELDKESLEFDIIFPYLSVDNYTIVHGKGLIYNPDDEKIYVEIDDLNEPVEWVELDISVQEMIVNDIHTQYRAEKIYKELSSKNEFN